MVHHHLGPLLWTRFLRTVRSPAGIFCDLLVPPLIIASVILARWIANDLCCGDRPAYGVVKGSKNLAAPMRYLPRCTIAVAPSDPGLEFAAFLREHRGSIDPEDVKVMQSEEEIVERYIHESLEGCTDIRGEACNFLDLSEFRKFSKNRTQTMDPNTLCGAVIFGSDKKSARIRFPVRDDRGYPVRTTSFFFNTRSSKGGRCSPNWYYRNVFMPYAAAANQFLALKHMDDHLPSVNVSLTLNGVAPFEPSAAPFSWTSDARDEWLSNEGTRQRLRMEAHSFALDFLRDKIRKAVLTPVPYHARAVESFWVYNAEFLFVIFFVCAMLPAHRQSMWMVRDPKDTEALLVLGAGEFYFAVAGWLIILAINLTNGCITAALLVGGGLFENVAFGLILAHCVTFGFAITGVVAFTSTFFTNSVISSVACFSAHCFFLFSSDILTFESLRLFNFGSKAISALFPHVAFAHGAKFIGTIEDIGGSLNWQSSQLPVTVGHSFVDCIVAMTVGGIFWNTLALCAFHAHGQHRSSSCRNVFGRLCVTSLRCITFGRFPKFGATESHRSGSVDSAEAKSEGGYDVSERLPLRDPQGFLRTSQTNSAGGVGDDPSPSAAMFTEDTPFARVPTQSLPVRMPTMVDDEDDAFVSMSREEESQCVIVRSLTKHFIKRRRLIGGIHDLNLTARIGQILVLVGRNGSGKSAALKVLMGLTKPTFCGRLAIFGHEYPECFKLLRSNIGVCLQNDTLWDHMSVTEHLIFAARLKNPHQPVKDAELRNILGYLGILNLAHVRAQFLPKGTKRVVSVAMAFVGNPSLVILDEPCAGVSVQQSVRIWALLKAMRPTKCVIMTTHQLWEADALADKVAILVNGRLKMFGTPLFLKRSCCVSYSLTVSVSPCAELEKLHSFISQFVPRTVQVCWYEGVVVFSVPSGDSDALIAFCAIIEKNKKAVGIQSYWISSVNLDEVFLHLTRIADEDFSPRATSRAAKSISSNPLESSFVLTSPASQNRQLPQRSPEFNSRSKPAAEPDLSSAEFSNLRRNPTLTSRIVAMCYLKWRLMLARKGISFLKIFAPTLFTVVILMTVNFLLLRGTGQKELIFESYLLNHAPVKHLDITFTETYVESAAEFALATESDFFDDVHIVSTLPPRRENTTQARYWISLAHQLAHHTHLEGSEEETAGGMAVVGDNKSTRKVALFHSSTASHSGPVLLNRVANAAFARIHIDTMEVAKRLKRLNLLPPSATEGNRTSDFDELPPQIQISNAPLPETARLLSEHRLRCFSLFMLVALCPVIFSGDVVHSMAEERTKSLRYHIYLNGLTPFTYWSVSLAIEFLLHCIATLVICICMYFLGFYPYIYPNVIMAVALLLSAYGLASLVETYALTAIFEDSTLRQHSSVCLKIVAALAYHILKNMRAAVGGSKVIEYLTYVATVFPSFGVSAGLWELKQMAKRPNEIETAKLFLRPEIFTMLSVAVLGWLAVVTADHVIYEAVLRARQKPDSQEALVLHPRSRRCGCKTLRRQSVAHSDASGEMSSKHKGMHPTNFRGNTFDGFSAQSVSDFSSTTDWQMNGNTGQPMMDDVGSGGAYQEESVCEERRRVKMIEEHIQLENNTLLLSDVGKTVKGAYRSSSRAVRGGQQRVLDSISLAGSSGEMIALLGPGGSGKSTLLKVIAGKTRFDRGHIIRKGMTDVGYLPSSDPLWEELSPYENLFFFATLHGLGTRETRDMYVRAKLEEVNISHMSQYSSSHLSPGLRRRWGVAMATLGNPALILVDEATRSVDTRGQLRIRSILRRAAGAESGSQMINSEYCNVSGISYNETARRSLVISGTASAREALKLGHRVATIDEGRIRSVDSAAEQYCDSAFELCVKFIAPTMDETYDFCMSNLGIPPEGCLSRQQLHLRSEEFQQRWAMTRHRRAEAAFRAPTSPISVQLELEERVTARTVAEWWLTEWKLSRLLYHLPNRVKCALGDEGGGMSRRIIISRQGRETLADLFAKMGDFVLKHSGYKMLEDFVLAPRSANRIRGVDSPAGGF